MTIRNAVVSDNSGGQSAIYVGAANVFGDSPSLNLEGCLTLENNSPADIIDGGSYLTDKSTGPCENPDQIGSPDPASSAPSAPRIADKSKRVRRPEYTQKKVRTCPELAPEILVTDMTGSTQCQRIGARGVGITHVLEAGLIDAVDVWSWVAQDTSVCFQASGAALVFLDAAYAPRRVSVLPVQRFNGLTCTTIHGEGSVVLLHSLPAGLGQRRLCR